MIEAKDISVSFGGRTVFTNISFSLAVGEKLVLTGPSGSGKSTMLNVCMGFVPFGKTKDRQVAGSVKIAGKTVENIRHVRSLMAWMPQELSFSALSCDELFYWPFRFAVNKKNYPDKKATENMLSLFGLDYAILGKPLTAISGGQKQRLVLCSLLLLKKNILLLDEPTAALDEHAANTVMNYLFEQKELTIISSSHNPAWVLTSDI